ncbi:MAG: ATP-dependent DNA helicase RecG [Gammaproteobacteria bacterium]|jgi:ATP-dependent DNA helicase RecG|nr:ATP-dependent DNA helicase RecG [Gammaproteobacteria bacterium]
MTQDESFEYQSVQTLKGVGPAVAIKLEKLGLYTLQDVLFHLPLRYEDRTRVVPIGALQPGRQVVIEGVIEHSEVRLSRRGRSWGKGRAGSGRSLLCYLADSTGGILLRFFHFNASQQATLAAGKRIRCFGEVRYGASSLEIAHPEYQSLTEHEQPPMQTTLTPVYPKTEGVHQTLLRNLAAQTLTRLRDEAVPEWLPESLLKEKAFPGLSQALEMVHHPDAETSLRSIEAVQHPAQQRLIFEELVAYRLSMMQCRQKTRSSQARAFQTKGETLNSFVKTLGFELTAAQKKVVREIIADLKNSTPMMRLLQGDVGSGKTAVAACAALAVVNQSFQVAIMAPTEILAGQLYENFNAWFSDWLGNEPNNPKDIAPQACLLLTGKDKGKSREAKLARIKQGEVRIVVGTHALFQDDVAFKNLALIIVDEQHRFGVHQRLSLREKGAHGQWVPHQLIMTATPIPRSLAMTAYADLDYSIIDELPAGRKQISTVVISDQRRDEVITRVAGACRNGEQAYWVCTLVEESEFLQCQAAEATALQLHQDLDDLSIGLVHGRMKQEEKDAVVARFKAGEINLLVATTVIEVGVDVPGASLMIIENAERLGLSQLHQLRGRVGRGEKQSACVLMYQSPLSERARHRLAILRQNNSGFIIAQKDLEMRGAGEVLGTRPTGVAGMRIADVLRDEFMLEEVKLAATQIQQQYPKSIAPLVTRWLGRSQRYGSV